MVKIYCLVSKLENRYKMFLNKYSELFQVIFVARYDEFLNLLFACVKHAVYLTKNSPHTVLKMSSNSNY